MKNIIYSFLILIPSYSFCQMQWNWVKPNTPSNTYFTSTSYGNKIFLIGSGSTLLESSNAGSSWNDLSASFKPFAQLESGDLSNHYICFVSESIGYIADLRYVHKTTDGGKTWSPVLSIYPYDFCTIHFYNENVGWISSFQKYRTTNGGKSWITMGDIPESDGFVAGFTSVDSLHVWAFTVYNIENKTGGKIKYSTDGGSTWVDQNIGIVSSSDTSYSILDMKMQSSGIGIASVIKNIKGIYQPTMFLLRTSNFGVAWENVCETPGAYPSVIAISDSLWVVVGNNPWGAKGSAYQTSILRSTDFGVTWATIPFAQDKSAPRTAQYMKYQNTLIAAGWNGVIYRSTDYGVIWEEISKLNPIVNSLATGNLQGVNDYGVAVGNNGYFLASTDYGEHWDLHILDGVSNKTFISSNITNKIIRIGTNDGNLYQVNTNSYQCHKILTPLDTIFRTYNPLGIKDIEFMDSIHGAIAASMGNGQIVTTPSYIFCTDDGGVSWKTTMLPTKMHANSVSFISNSCFYVGGLYFPPGQNLGVGFIWRTTDFGQTWDTNTVSRYINKLQMNDPTNGYAGSNGALIVTKDGGKTWTNGFSNAYDINAIAKESEQIVWAVSGSELIKSTDAGMIWSSTGPQIPSNQSATSIAIISQGKMILSLAQGGFLSTYLSSIMRVNQDHPSVTPDKFFLFQNFPNPFNPTTNISFFIHSTSFVSLKIIDLTGRELVTLVSEEKFAGGHSVQWNGSRFASGIYFCRLQVGSLIQTRKLLLLK